MLTTLRIKNLALVADLTLELQPGYNAVTGETGAGKSIIIGALNLVLGERADRTLIRGGAESCSVEAVFDLSDVRTPLRTFLDENGVESCEDNQLVLKRSFTAAGTNRQFINGSPTTLQVLAVLGEWLVDMHGPHDHQSLLHPARQLSILDAFGKLHPLREVFAELVWRRAGLETEKTALIVDEKTYAQQLDLLRFQVNEITAARLQPNEEIEVEQEFQRSSNGARLLELSQAALNILSEDEASLLTQAASLGRALLDLRKIDASAAPLLSLHEQAVTTLHELQLGLSEYCDQIEIDPARLKELEERINVLHSLKRKYGSALADVMAFGEEAREKLNRLEQSDVEIERINRELTKIDGQLIETGKELAAQRRKLIPKLNKAVMKHLSDLGFKQSRFEVAMKTLLPPERENPEENQQPSTCNFQLGATGFDTVEFQFAPNPGEPARPLRAIASSGEMARVMLALKTVLAAEDEIPVLVFDEVDANVGGETAHAVGEKMRQIAKQRQVLCITHLAPVAAAATAHYEVSKEFKEGRTVSEIRLLDRQERVNELARMLGGLSAAALKHAEELLTTNEKFGYP